jgi:hypothetical protein
VIGPNPRGRHIAAGDNRITPPADVARLAFGNELPRASCSTRCKPRTPQLLFEAPGPMRTQLGRSRSSSGVAERLGTVGSDLPFQIAVISHAGVYRPADRRCG